MDIRTYTDGGPAAPTASYTGTLAKSIVAPPPHPDGTSPSAITPPPPSPSSCHPPQYNVPKKRDTHATDSPAYINNDIMGGRTRGRYYAARIVLITRNMYKYSTRNGAGTKLKSVHPTFFSDPLPITDIPSSGAVHFIWGEFVRLSGRKFVYGYKNRRARARG